jgi:hypothetical protein
MVSRGNDSVVEKGLDRNDRRIVVAAAPRGGAADADPTSPEAPAAKRQHAFRRRWSFGLSVGTMVLLLLVVLGLLYRTSPRPLGSAAKAAASAPGISRPAGF